MYRWIGPRALNFTPDIAPLHHFRFLHYRPKTVYFVEIFWGIELIRSRTSVNRVGALTRSYIRRRGAANLSEAQTPFSKTVVISLSHVPTARMPHYFNTGTGKRRLPIRTTTTIINATVVKRILCCDSPSSLDNQQQTRALINGPRISMNSSSRSNRRLTGTRSLSASTYVHGYSSASMGPIVKIF